MNVQDIPRKYGQPVLDDYVAIDLEHNGHQENESLNQLLQVAAVVVSRGAVKHKFYMKIKLQVEFNEHLTKHLGLVKEDYLDDDLPSEKGALTEFKSTLAKNPLVAHDVGADLRVLGVRLAINELGDLKPVCADTKTLYLGYINGKEYSDKCNLKTVAEKLNLPEFEEHNALQDALAHARIYEKIVHGRELSE